MQKIIGTYRHTFVCFQILIVNYFKMIPLYNNISLIIFREIISTNCSKVKESLCQIAVEHEQVNHLNSS